MSDLTMSVVMNSCLADEFLSHEPLLGLRRIPPVTDHTDRQHVTQIELQLCRIEASMARESFSGQGKPRPTSADST
jgi:hypothetical protein